jgi:hypothetical protein
MSARSKPLEIPDLNEVMEEVSDLRAEVKQLLSRQDASERALAAGMTGTDADEPITGMRAIAAAIGLKSVKTLRGWASDVDLAERHKLAMLLKRTPSGRWSTTRRLIQQWRRATATNPWEVPS